MRTNDEILAAHFRDINYLDGGCWTWAGRTLSWGYGFVTQGTRKIPAHRFFYELLLGREIIEGMVIDHLCENKLCVNPMHMEVVTSGENVRRAQLGRKRPQGDTCRKGHPYLTYGHLKSNGRYSCKECGRLRQRDYRAKESVHGW